MEFPPRGNLSGYLDLNILGTVPTFIDGGNDDGVLRICHYLAEKYGPFDIALKPDHPKYGEYVNWLYRSDATLTFPQTLVLRYTRLEPRRKTNTPGSRGLFYMVSVPTQVGGVYIGRWP